MKPLFPKRLVVALLFCFLLASCKGGGGSLSAGGGIDGTGFMSAGVVSSFGSIIVNGTEFDTGNAVVVVKGEETGVGDDDVRAILDIGRVVTVEGRIKADGSAVADRVLYSPNVVGPVESVSEIDATTREIVVMGQTVIVNVITKFKETSFDMIGLNDVVEVSGYVDDSGVVRATFLEKEDMAAISEYEVTGFVDNLDVGLNEFMINSLRVDYSSIADDLPEGIPADRLYAEVEGFLDGTTGGLVATAIEPADTLEGVDGDELEIMGFVTRIISDADIIEFKVGNQVVRVDADSVGFVDGTADDIAPGIKLEAEGSLKGGILIAEEVEFWKPDQIEVEDFVTEVVSDTEFTLGGWLVHTDNAVFEPEGLEIENGLRIEVKGVPRDIRHRILEGDKVSIEED